MKSLFIGSLLLVLASCQTLHSNRTDDISKNIHEAAKNGDTKKVAAFLKTGVQVNVKDKNGRTPLHLAAEKGYLQVVKLLIKSGADVNAKDQNGTSALHKTSEVYIYNSFFQFIPNKEECLGIVQLLIKNGADVNDIDNRTGFTPLYWPMMTGKGPKLSNLLLKNGVNINFKDSTGCTALHLASAMQNLNAVKFLLKNGADVNHRKTDCEGITPLHWVSIQEDLKILKLLISKTSDINAQDKYGSTPLHWASRNGYSQNVKFLIKKGADANIKNKKGQTPLNVAKDQKTKKSLLKSQKENRQPVSI